MLIEDWPTTKVRPYPNNPRVLRNAAAQLLKLKTVRGAGETNEFGRAWVPSREG